MSDDDVQGAQPVKALDAQSGAPVGETQHTKAG